ncbi:hypothetical protein RCH16_003507 [Cryobacterium sp. MP_M5]|uniref:DUF1648 domain-containing protein n=1 Tax=unclassified Cryobacterium TaxID=2649013 RepID=UPI0018CA14F2|nr:MULTISPECIES: DUF1648 domain-containing protein [unclassified Cryobacterium]MBG6060054.1 hypothetical protein [Cryobacterium sp. MP_M3]MEC5178468.1 hypothetical protein [Cryobacterium sp. MP_M5]
MITPQVPSFPHEFVPATVTVTDDFFARLTAAARSTGIHLPADAVGDLRDHVLDRLAGTPGLPADAERVLLELGSPESLAAAFAVKPSRWGAGRVLGVPFDLRSPTSERYASRSWNPLDRHVLVPKALGIGWTINFGAIAVHLHAVRPDDEDIPFAAVPPRAVDVSFVGPLAALVGFATVAALSWANLPAMVPTHWGLLGEVDEYGTRESALLLVSAIAGIPVVLAGWVHVRRRPTFNRVGASALSLSGVLFASAILAQTIYTVDGGHGLWPTLVGFLCALALPLGLLVVMSRIGRRAEQRRDFHLAPPPQSQQPKGRVR